MEPGRTLLRPDDVTLRYWLRGNGDHPFVFLHGLAGYAGEWWPLTGGMEDGLKVLAVDQRGHGQSTRRPTDLSRQAYVDDVAALIEAGAGGRGVTLVGQSMGAHTAMLTAAGYPELVDRLVMIEGGVGGGGRVALEQVQASLLRWPASFPSRQAAVEFFGGGRTAEVWADGLEIRDGALRSAFDLEVMVEAMRPILQAPAWAAWMAVQQPTLIALGDSGTIDRDQIDLMTRSRPEVQVKTIQGAGHDIHLDQPHLLADILRDFITD